MNEVQANEPRLQLAEVVVDEKPSALAYAADLCRRVNSMTAATARVEPNTARRELQAQRARKRRLIDALAERPRQHRRP